MRWTPASSSTRQNLLKSRVLFKHDKKELELAAKVALRAKVATLHSLGLSERKIEKLVGKSRYFVRTWKNETCFLDKPGRGRKRTALTPKNLRKLEGCELKDDQSNRRVGKKLGISKSSVSRGFLGLGMPARKRPKASKLKPNHVKWRFACAKNYRHASPEFWENFLITDETIWTTNGMVNPQNDRVRARDPNTVESREVEKFPGSRMVWLGMSARGTTPLHWFKGNVNGETYRMKILKKIVLEDVLQREDDDAPINRRKLFERNDDMVFEQDFATPHSTNVNEDFMSTNFPQHTPTLHRFRGKHDLYFPPKMDDFWPIERVWAILAARIYRNPRPTHISGVMRRVREAVRELDATTLTKLVHEMPAKMQEIYRLKGQKISPGWKAKNSKYACRCSVCSS